MTLDEYSQSDASALAALVNRGETTPNELAQLALVAIDRLNPQLNAIVEVYSERAQKLKSDRQTGAPLAGVPMLLKDTGATDKDKAQSCGSLIGTGYIATADSYLTEHYKNAGLNILGRTAMPELAQAATTESALSGATRNPWDLSRSTGGSSGGAAAAVASGMVPVAHGTDTGGSIRIPAACCGLVGLKPSRGRISKGPALDEALYGGLNTEHVLTRSIRDTAAILDISCQPETGDNFIIAPPERSYSQELGRAVAPLQIAVTCQTHTGVSVDPEMANATDQIAQLLETMGHHVTQATPKIESEAYGWADTVVWSCSTAHEVTRLSNVTGNAIDERYLERPTLEALGLANKFQISDWFNAMAIYNRMCRTFGTFFAEYDLLLTPTVAWLTPELGILNSNQNISYDQFMHTTANFCPHTAPFNVTGQPAISLPLCTSDEGLPIGIQLVARYGDESTLIRIAAQLEEALPWRHRLPPIHAINLQTVKQKN